MSGAILISLLYFSSMATNSPPPWNASGPDGGEIRSFDPEADFLRIGTKDGVYESQDGGANWSRLGDFPRGAWVDAVASKPGNPSIVLASSNQLYRSTDSGAHWAAVGPALQGGIVFNPSTPDDVLGFDFSNFALHRSSDAGATWSTTTTPGSLQVEGIAAHSSALHGFYLSTWEPYLYYSADAGASWNLVEDFANTLQPQRATRLTPDPFDANILLWLNGGLDQCRLDRYTFNLGVAAEVTASGYQSICQLVADPLISGRFWFGNVQAAGQREFESLDHGASWSDVAALPGALLGADRTTSGVLYANDARGFARSLDAGRSWTSRAHGIPLAKTLSISIRPDAIDEILAAGPDWGIALSTDGGTTWSDSVDGLTSFGVTNLARAPGDPQTVYASTNQLHEFVSHDGGRHWAEISVASAHGPVSIALVDGADATQLVGNSGSQLMLSSDSGATWTDAPTSDNSTGFTAVARAASGNGAIYAVASGRGVYRADAFGATFSPTAGALVPTAIAVHPQDDNVLMAYTSEGAWSHWLFYRSRDGGASWQLRGTLTPTSSQGFLPVFTFDPCDATTLYALAGKAFYVSHDQGATWNEEPIAIPDYYFHAIDARCVSGNLAIAAATENAGAQVRASVFVDPIFADRFSGD